MGGGCGGCGSTEIDPHPDKPGLFKCSGCGAQLTRMRKRYGHGYVYIVANRPDVQIHGMPRAEGESS